MQSLGPHREDPEPLDLFSSRGVSKLPKTTVEQTQRLSEVPANARAGRRMVQFFPLGSAHPRHLSFLATLPSSAFAALRPPFRRKTVSSSALPQRGGGLLRVDDKTFLLLKLLSEGTAAGVADDGLDECRAHSRTDVVGPALVALGLFWGCASDTGVTQTSKRRT